MTIHGPSYLRSIEIPIARIFRKITGRKMTGAERRCFRIKATHRVRTYSRTSLKNCPNRDLRLHHASLTHDRFGFLTDFAGDLKGIALLEFRQEEFHREGTGISLVRKLIKNSD